MAGYIVAHPESGKVSDVFNTYAEAEAEILAIIGSNIDDAVEQEIEDQEGELRTAAEIEEDIRKEWLSDYFVCEAELDVA
ncbi:hypothetical protein IFT69_10280 [Pseudomonas putida]|nr:hypothetical protein [Pseudomonas putida]